MAKKQYTLFKKPKYKYLSDIISFKDPESAKESAKKLKKEFNDSKTKAKKLRIYRATILSSNRAKAMLNKKNLSAKERKEFREIAKIYRDLASIFKLKY